MRPFAVAALLSMLTASASCWPQTAAPPPASPPQPTAQPTAQQGPPQQEAPPPAAQPPQENPGLLNEMGKALE